MGTLSSKVGYCILFAILTAATLFLRVTKPDVLVEHGGEIVFRRLLSVLH